MYHQNMNLPKPFYLKPPKKFSQFPPQYSEPEDLMRQRIVASLPALNKFILDDSIPSAIIVSQFNVNSPLFLATDNKGKVKPSNIWGRISWIRDLGELGYKPAFEHLHEVWQYDRDDILKKYALIAMSKLQDERLLNIIEKSVDNGMFFSEDWKDWFISSLSNYKNEKAVRILEKIYNEASYLNKGCAIDNLAKKDQELFGAGSMGIKLEDIVLALSRIKTPIAIKLIKRIGHENPNHHSLRRKVKESLPQTKIISLSNKVFSSEILKPVLIGEEYEIVF